MDIIVFSPDKNILEQFKDISRGKDITLVYKNISGLKDAVKNLPPCEIVYIDISSQEETELKKTLNLMYKNIHVRFGVIDPGGLIAEVAALFHHGVSDYIGPKELSSGITRARIKEILEFKECRLDDSFFDNIVSDKNIIIARGGWKNIKVGTEYTFCTMYIRLENTGSIKKNYGHIFFEELIVKFQKQVEMETEKIDGRIWLWDDNSGVIIFPFDGKSCEAILTCFKMMRDRIFVSIESCNCPFLLEYTILLHLGNITYSKRRKTGTIISESINFIFHAAEQVEKKGHLYITNRLFSYIPAGIRDLFLDAMTFEGHNMKRLKGLKFYKNTV